MMQLIAAAIIPLHHRRDIHTELVQGDQRAFWRWLLSEVPPVSSESLVGEPVVGKQMNEPMARDLLAESDGGRLELDGE